MEERVAGEMRPGLTPAERAAVVGLALLVFAFVEGPVWRHAWNPDASILWSYAVVPALVLVFLARSHRLRLGTFLSETLVLCVFKFGISAIALIGLWSLSAPPGVPRDERLSVWIRPPGTSLKGETREVEARRPSLLPSTTVEIGGGKIVPAAIALVPAMPIAFQSSDGRLHSLELVASDGSVRANVPVLASGSPRTLSFEEISRASALRCAVHPEERATVRSR
jgi:hypothetical protein